MELVVRWLTSEGVRHLRGDGAEHRSVGAGLAVDWVLDCRRNNILNLFFKISLKSFSGILE